MKNFKGILVLGEKNIFNNLSQIISISIKANVILKSMYKYSMNAQLMIEGMNSIRMLEKESDEIASSLNEHITAGAISPNLINDLIECVRVADNIVEIRYYKAVF